MLAKAMMISETPNNYRIISGKMISISLRDINSMDNKNEIRLWTINN